MLAAARLIAPGAAITAAVARRCRALTPGSAAALTGPTMTAKMDAGGWAGALAAACGRDTATLKL